MGSGPWISDEMARLLDEVDPETGKTWRERFLELAREKALAGDKGLAEFLERAERARGESPKG